MHAAISTAMSKDNQPDLPIELAQAVLVTAIRTTRVVCSSHDGAANLSPVLNVLGPRAQFPSITFAAIIRCWWIHLDYASERGDTNLANLLASMSSSYPFRPLQYSTKAIDAASANGHLNMLKWWTDVARDQLGMGLVFTPEAMAQAKTVQLLDWWESEADLPRFYPSHCVFACMQGDLDLFRWWFPRAGANSGRDCYDEAVENGHHHLLREYGSGPFFCHNETTEKALYRGDVFALQWLRDNAPDSFTWIDNPKDEMVKPVFDSGELDAVRWVLDYLGDSFQFGHGLDEFKEWVGRAAGSGGIDLLKWTLSQESGIGDEQARSSCKAIPASTAIQGGHIAVLEWCMAQGYELEYDNNAVRWACQRNRVDVLAWLQKHGLPFQLSDMSMWSACRAGSLDILRFWHEHQPETFVLAGGAFESACSRDHVDVVRFLASFPNSAASMTNSADAAFRQACGNGATRVLQWWLDESGLALPVQDLKTSAAHILCPNAVDSASSNAQQRNDSSQVSLHRYYNVKTVVWFLENGFLDIALAMRDLVLFSFEVQLLDRLAKLGAQFDDADASDGPVLDIASECGDIGMLDWWKQHVSRSARPIPLRYSAHAMDSATRNGHVGVLQWWAKSNLEFRFPREVYERAKAVGPDAELEYEAVVWWDTHGLAGRQLDQPAEH